MSCSFPIFRQWLEDRFGDLCEQHDVDYVKRVWVRKVASDFEFCAGMASRGYTALSLCAFLYFTIFGTIYWLWKKYRRAL
jgi:hypothetical protein